MKNLNAKKLINTTKCALKKNKRSRIRNFGTIKRVRITSPDI